MTDSETHSASAVAAPSLMRSGDEAGVLTLHASVFGPGRFARTAFRLREKAAPLACYSFVSRAGEKLVGAVSMSRIAIGETQGVLLGPLAVMADQRDHGVGKALLHASVAAAFAAGEPYVLLVGDLPYYAAAGFERVPLHQVQMPGPVDPARLLIALNPDLQAPCPAGTVRGA